MKKKSFMLVTLSVMMILIAGCSSAPTSTTQAGTPAPDGQITVPGVDIQINSPAITFQVVMPGPNPLINKADEHGRLASVLVGIWHGVISPVTLIVSFIDQNVQMYEVHNDGGLYNFGFLLGVAILFTILGVFAGSRRRR